MRLSRLKRPRRFDRDAQLALIDLLAAGVERQAAEQDAELKSADRKNLALAAAVLVDKHRLIMGEATQITTDLGPDEVRELERMRERAALEARRLGVDIASDADAPRCED
jgi:hypothetical protein